MNNMDLTFITNEGNKNLKSRFQSLIKDTKDFDCLVGYFYTSGFHSIYKSLINTDKIRILVGIRTGSKARNLVKGIKPELQQSIPFSHAEAKKIYENTVQDELAKSDDKKEVEKGIYKFIEWIKNGKLEIRAFPSQNIHSKLYIMTFQEGDRDIGRVITGSSNFTKSGLEDNLEFNVELKKNTDYKFAKEQFEALWKRSVDVSERYIDTINNKTWLNQKITPYQIYLKFLYEYFKEELNQITEVNREYTPKGFKKLEYQDQAVFNAKKILEEYGGVFISDVVGLGKTYITVMLLGQIDGRTLIIAPPALIDKNNPGSWKNALSDFKTHADCESIGKLEHILRRGTDKYKNIVVDEAHRFRTETNKTYEQLAEICRGKRVILVTATPYNNTPKDILSQIKLFQKVRNSTIPNMPNLESFFNRLEKKVKDLDRKKDYEVYMETVKNNARKIREKVLKYLMVRRTRGDIEKYFKDDTIAFPEVLKPEPLFYQLNDKENKIFNKTVKIITKQINYARYRPLSEEYYKKPIDQPTTISQKNMSKLMEILLIKRLESSFFAFRQSVDRFINSYRLFIRAFENGNVYMSKKYSYKIFEHIENGNDKAIHKLIEEEKAKKFSSDDFTDNFIIDLKNDIETLNEVKNLWNDINRDPKLKKFIDELSNNKILSKNKIIIFTESTETAEYLTRQLKEKYSKKILCFTGDSSGKIRNKVLDNFDAKAHNPKDNYRILISTEVLSEGVNLHRSNVVINYDIPWNPTRMMQRVGRVNRVDTDFYKIYTFNFFPTEQANSEIKLKEAAESKINAFLTLLGGDAELLTEGEPIGSHELFNRLISKETLTGEDQKEDNELKYLNVIKDIRKNEQDLFGKIKKLPKKSRSSKNMKIQNEALITYFRKDKIEKFYLSNANWETKELDFIEAARLLETDKKEKRIEIPDNFYSFIDQNKKAFIRSTTVEKRQPTKKRGRASSARLVKVIEATLNSTKRFTEEQEKYMKKLIKQLKEGAIPKHTAKEALKAVNNLEISINNTFKILAILQKKIPKNFLQKHYAEKTVKRESEREVILSLFLSNNQK